MSTARGMQAGVTICGCKPAANQTIPCELQANCSNLLTDQHFDLFDALIDLPVMGLSEIDAAMSAVEGDYVPFFEQAFEWKATSCVPDPSFWGRQVDVVERHLHSRRRSRVRGLPTRAQRGWSCLPARVRIRRGRRKFCGPWQAGPLPMISDKTHLPIGLKIAQRLGMPDPDVSVGVTWEAQLPTQPMHLRKAQALPRWTKWADGHSAPDEEP
ncbi:hypothetical protein [Mycolicibacterium arseniciresistens]|uniref:Uncharacterized protein n=1 Tax=Mycolicibacterium arseniciresistens TaxID=3062257 RepID=A0ABT8UNF0_9MYCO|nr:hypothetical protein [Mycolicibacterium arseniciresistens]MDO3639333.1 hypothetical protein [Mycolicibacterium arseniciresistens]